MVTKTVTVHDAQIQLPELLTLALEGNEVIIIDGDKSVVRLVPISSPKNKKPRIAGLDRGKIWVSEDFDDPLPEGFWTGSK
jgi:antitoxin (DNA-binding transcriptional repressor) of toxin-antitoxin stability system